MIGASWATGSWTDAWAPGSWAGSVIPVEESALAGSASSQPVLDATITNHPMGNKLIVGSTNTVSLKGLKNTETRPPVYLDDATVELTALFDANDIAVAGTENIPMPYISGVGHSVLYRGAIPHYVALVAGQSYTRRITATDTDDNVRVFDKVIVAEAG